MGRGQWTDDEWHEPGSANDERYESCQFPWRHAAATTAAATDGQPDEYGHDDQYEQYGEYGKHESSERIEDWNEWSVEWREPGEQHGDVHGHRPVAAAVEDDQ